MQEKMNKEDTHARVELLCRVENDEKWKDLISYLSRINDIRIVNQDKISNSLQIEVSHSANISILDLQKNIENDTKVQTVLKGIGDKQAVVSELIGNHGVVGVVRLSQLVGSSCIVDGAIDGIPSKRCSLNIHSYGDLSGTDYENIGPVYQEILQELKALGGYSSFHFVLPDCNVASTIGRSLAVSSIEESRILAAGIAARASTVGENTQKKICLCSGETVWEERERMRNNTIPIFSIPESLIINPSTNFDKILEERWDLAQSLGLFRFPVTKGSLEYRNVEGTLGFVAQFNEGRGFLRRKPQNTIHLKMPFNDNLFNFTKVDESEALLKIEVANLVDEAVILINNSPIEWCSSLLVPNPEKKYPQIATKESIIMALSIMSSSGDTTLRMGFNSLGAAASVNHLHWHLYRLPFPLLVEDTPIDSNGIISKWSLPGFAFDIPDASLEKFESIATKAINIIDKCYEANLAYNCFITHNKTGIRLIVWPRIAELGTKDDTELVAAFCEFTGFFICKTRECFDKLTEEECLKVISSVKANIDLKSFVS